MKTNIAYYSHDAQSHNHWKFKALRARFGGVEGWAAEGRFWALNNMIAESPNCQLDISSLNKQKAIAAELGYAIDGFTEFIHCLERECELVINTNGILTTNQTQKVLHQVMSKRENDRDRKVFAQVPDSASGRSGKDAKQEDSAGKQQLSAAENEQTKLNETKEAISSVATSGNTDSLVGKSSASSGATAPPTPKSQKKGKTQIEKQANMLVRRKVFEQDLVAYQDRYPKPMLNAFYKYWGEATRGKTKMKWELQHTWELDMRLSKWQSNDEKWNPAKGPPAAAHSSSSAVSEDFQKNIKNTEKKNYR